MINTEESDHFTLLKLLLEKQSKPYCIHSPTVIDSCYISDWGKTGTPTGFQVEEKDTISQALQLRAHNTLWRGAEKRYSSSSSQLEGVVGSTASITIFPAHFSIMYKGNKEMQKPKRVR